MTNPATMFGADLAPDADLDDPLDLLDRWLARVDAPSAVGPADVDASTTPLMALATVDADGDPCLRHVLLSAYDRGRLHFHSDTTSAKSTELRGHRRAAATIVWPDLPRQLVVRGPVSTETPTEALAAFHRRSRYLQLLAWVNDEQLARRSEGERRQAFAEREQRDEALEPPPTWVGYVLVPDRISFWRGGPGCPSQRLVCCRRGAGWSIERRPG